MTKTARLFSNSEMLRRRREEVDEGDEAGAEDGVGDLSGELPHWVNTTVLSTSSASSSNGSEGDLDEEQLREDDEWEELEPSEGSLTVYKASMNVSEKLDLVADLVSSDKVPESVYLELCSAVKSLHDAKTHSADTEGAVLEGVRSQLSEIVSDHIREMSQLQEQLRISTMATNHFKSRKDHFARATLALKGLCASHGIADTLILQAYDSVGIKEQVLSDRALKRRRVNQT